MHRARDRRRLGGPCLPRDAHRQAGPHLVFDLGDLLTRHRLGKAERRDCAASKPLTAL